MEKEVIGTMLKDASGQSITTNDTGNLAEAVKWVYQQYGKDLSAFFRDAYKDAERKHQEKVSPPVEACGP